MRKMNKTLHIVIFLLTVLLLTVCNRKNNIPSNNDLKSAIKNGALVVDVRTAQEYAADHYSGATNIPLNEIDNKVSQFGEKNKTIIVYCASGIRSSRAKAKLEALGFTNVINAGRLKEMPE